MKTLLQIFSFLFFVSLMFAQEENYDQFRRDRHNQYRSQIDRRKALNQKETNRSSNNMPQQLEQNSKPTHKIFGSGVDTAWVRHCGWNDFSLTDEPVAVVVDGSGNVIVAGNNGMNGTGPGGPPLDFMIIKYNQNGDLLWARYRLGSNINRKDALATDPMGNVYVALGSEGIVSGVGCRSVSKYITVIKYAANGDTVWVRRYNGIANQYDSPSSLVIGGNGNILVTGTSRGLNNLYSYATVKYKANGDEEWVRRYNGANGNYVHAVSLTSDVNENVFVTGISGGDIQTIKYTANGDSVWGKLYDSKTSTDVARSIALDGGGNVYISGHNEVGPSSPATIKYNSSGDMLWQKQYGPPDHYWESVRTVDKNGNAYCIGHIDDTSYAVVKYNSFGDTMWLKRYSECDPTSIAVDGNQDVYVAGNIIGSVGYSTAKLDPQGDTLWVKRYFGQTDIDGRVSALTVDVAGNVYVTGWCATPSTNSDFVTIKYNPQGDILWVRRYHSPGESVDRAFAYALAVDAGGNVYVTGNSTGLAYTISRLVTIKYNQNGETIWAKRFNGIGNSYDYPQDLAVDGIGNVYATGTNYSNDPFQAPSTYLVIKYNSLGDTLWVRRYSSPETNNNVLYSLCLDAVGNVYVTGSSGNEIATVKYSASGMEEWVARFSDGEGSYDTPCGVKVDGAGNVFVGGTSSSGVFRSMYTIIKYRQTPNAIGKDNTILPMRFALEQNFPNPFNPTTTIRYSLPSFAHVRLTVYNMLGQVVSELVNEEQSAGWKEVQWNASSVSSGIYFYKLSVGSFVETKKMMMVK
ncbi:MAG: T9SS type A sorting domain-containing protein [Bacteroidota bacterium]